MKYAVAYMSFLENELKMTTVDADSEATAMIAGARSILGAADTDEWLNDFDGSTAEQIREGFFDADQLVEALPIVCLLETES